MTVSDAEKKVVALMAVECAAQMMQTFEKMDRITLFRELEESLKVKTALLGGTIAIGMLIINSMMDRRDWEKPESLDDLLAAVRAGYALALFKRRNPKLDLADYLQHQMEID